MKDHVNIIENNVAKNLCLIYRAGDFLNKKSLINIYYSYISCYSYIPMVWKYSYI